MGGWGGLLFIIGECNLLCASLLVAVEKNAFARSTAAHLMPEAVALLK